MLARMACGKKPVSRATASPVSRSVATATKEIGKVRKSRMAWAGQVSPVNSCEIR